MVEPVLVDETPSRFGYFNKEQLGGILNALGCSAIAFEDRNSSNHVEVSSVRAITPNRANNFETAAGLWSNISRNIKVLNRNLVHALQRQSDLARALSIGLRSLDASIKAIHKFYASRLAYHLANGEFETKVGLVDLEIYSQVQRFFTAFGTVRDHLGGLIGQRLRPSSLKLDDLARVQDAISFEELEKDCLFSVLLERGLVARRDFSTKSQQADWLAYASSLRNKYIHRQPYGYAEEETQGFLIKSVGFQGGYKYFRPLARNDGTIVDALDALAEIYVQTMELFIVLAYSSDYDCSMPILSELNFTTDKKPLP